MQVLKVNVLVITIASVPSQPPITFSANMDFELFWKNPQCSVTSLDSSDHISSIIILLFVKKGKNHMKCSIQRGKSVFTFSFQVAKELGFAIKDLLN